jgi:[ribosomal protein S5]-alanine N-acetyltransferase
MNAPERLKTARLLLRKPRRADAELIFTRYAADSEVTKFLSWPQHVSIEQTRAFLEYSDRQWERWPAGPYLIEDLKDARLLGSTGFAFENPQRAVTGYVLAKDSWGIGYATEALHAIVRLAETFRIAELFALCHPDHEASYRVLEKCGFVRQLELVQAAQFPNLAGGSRAGALRYVLDLSTASGLSLRRQG